VPPALVAVGTIVLASTRSSDAEAVDATVLDRRGHLVLDGLDSTAAPPFSQRTLVAFRARLIAADLDRSLIERTAEFTAQTKGFRAHAVVRGAGQQSLVGRAAGRRPLQAGGARAARLQAALDYACVDPAGRVQWSWGGGRGCHQPKAKALGLVPGVTPTPSGFRGRSVATEVAVNASETLTPSWALPQSYVVWLGDLGRANPSPEGRNHRLCSSAASALRTLSPCGERAQVATAALVPENPVHPKGASCVRRVGVCTPTVPWQPLTCQSGFWAKAAKALAFPPTAKAGGVPRLKAR
jgi:hypothetical protein